MVFVVIVIFMALAAAAMVVVATIGDLRCWGKSKGWTYEWSFRYGCRIQTKAPVYIPIEEFLIQPPNKEQ